MAYRKTEKVLSGVADEMQSAACDCWCEGQNIGLICGNPGCPRVKYAESAIKANFKKVFGNHGVSED